MNSVTKVFIGIVLTFTASAVYSEPIDYSFSTSGIWYIDPLLSGLTSVSGSFIYENDAPPILIEKGNESTDYNAISSISGNANGNSFSDPLGFAAVNNDNYQLAPQQLNDIFVIGSSLNLNGFTFAGLELREVFFSWLEGVASVTEFLDDQSLPPVLPPTTGGLIELVFYGADEIRHPAFFNVLVVSVGPADTNSITFQGQIASIFEDNGAAIYSGVPIGSDFSGEIDIVTGRGSISDGTTVTPFSSTVFENGSFFEVTNNIILDADDASYLNSLPDSNFVAGDLVDLIEIEGEALTQSGGHINVSLSYVLDPLALDDENSNNYPPNPGDTLITFFHIDEENDKGDETYSAVATISQVTEALASLTDGVLAIPVVAVGNTFYQVNLNLTNAQTFEFQLGPIEVLSNPVTTGMSEFINPILSIPEVVVGSTSYSVELTLTNASTFTFILSDFEELNGNPVDSGTSGIPSRNTRHPWNSGIPDIHGKYDI